MTVWRGVLSKKVTLIFRIFQLCVEPAGPGFQLEIPLGVIIGSIPLRYTLEQYGLTPVSQGIDHSKLYQDNRPPLTSPPPSMRELYLLQSLCLRIKLILQPLPSD